MEKIRVLPEDSSVFNLQKIQLSDQILPATSNGKFVSVITSDNKLYLCQIFLRKLLHPSFCNIETSVYGYAECNENTRYPATRTVSYITLSSITILPSVNHIKSLTVSVVFTSPLECDKWKNSGVKLNELVKDILKLFVLRSGVVVSVDALRALFNVNIYHLLVENIGNVSFGRVVNSTKIKLNKLISKITFDQVYTARDDLSILGGLEEPMRMLTDIVKTVGVKEDKSSLPLYKQVLLLGPAGCGKTSLVHRVAHDCGLVLQSLAGPELSLPLPGESEGALTAVFERCKLLARECPGGCILLVENVESVCRRREGSAEGHIVRLAAQFCSLLEQVNTTPGLMVIGTSNQAQALDPAIRRPGRFDHEIHIRVSSESERLGILRALTRQYGLSESVCEQVAKWTPGFVGADLALLATSVVRHLQRLAVPLNCCADKELLSHWQTCVGRLQPSALRGQLGVVQLRADPPLGGVDHMKQRLLQAVQWPLTRPEAFTRMGLPHPKGVLLYGPPGCAKTSLAQAVAAQTNTTFLSVSAAQIYSPYVGDAERTITELFHRARIGAPAILFIDEIDALVGCRGHRERGTQERILTAFLTEMDGVGVRLDSQAATQGSVVVIAATNRPDVLDPALTRPGRFDRLLYVGPPDSSQRLDILRTITDKMPLASDVDLCWVAEQTELYSGADLTRLCKEAGLVAMTEEGMEVGEVSHRHWLSALESMGPSLTVDQLNKYKQMAAFGD